MESNKFSPDTESKGVMFNPERDVQYIKEGNLPMARENFEALRNALNEAI